MRKGLTTFLVILLALGAVLVSCKAEIEAPADELVAVSFEERTSRALSATLEEFNVNNYFWYYAAKKTDSTGLISGQTTTYDAAGAVAISTGDEAKGLSYFVPGFSQGTWKFTLYAYTERPETVEQKAAWVYSGEATGVVLKKNGTNTVSVTVNPNSQGDGFLFVDKEHIYLSEASDLSDNHVSPVITIEPITGETPVIIPETNVKYTAKAGTYLVTVAYTDGYITYATGDVIATVYPGLTTTVTGYVDELVTYAQFDADPNPDIVKETWGTAIINNDTPPTGNLTLSRALGSKTTKVESATMPAAAAVAKKDELAANVGADAGSSSLMLKLSVDTTEVTEQAVTYDIGMEAVLSYKKNGQSSETTSDIKNINDYVIVVIDLESDITDVSVKHSDVAMIKFPDSDAGYAAFLAATVANDAYINPDDPSEGYKGFYCLRTVGETRTLYIKTRSFSPFEVTYSMTDYVAMWKDKKYTSVSAAINAATDGTTVILLKNTSGAFTLNGEKTVTLDLAGHSFNGGDMWVIGDSTLKVDGRQSGSSVNGCFCIGRATNNNGNIEIDGGSYSCGENDTVLHINGTCLNSNVTIRNATITSPSDNGIQLNGSGKFLIENTTITGDTAIYVKSGTLTIEGGTFTGDKTPADYSYNGNGANATGDAIVIDACEYPGGNPTVIIKDGTFTGTKAAIGYYQYDGDKDGIVEGQATIRVEGGRYNTDPIDYVAEGYCVVMDGSYYKVVPAVAKIGTVYYGTLQSALNAAVDGDTVELLKDIEVTTQQTISNKAIVLDGNSFTVNHKGTYNSNTAVLYVTGSKSITIKDITIKGNGGAVEFHGLNGGDSRCSINISGSTFEGGFKSIFFNDCRNADIVFTNSDTRGVYGFNVNEGLNLTWAASGTTFGGWNSASNAFNQESFVFTECEFIKAYGYSVCKPYGSTTYNQCKFGYDYRDGIPGKKGIATGVDTPISLAFNGCLVQKQDGTYEALDVTILQSMLDYDITSGSSSGASTINKQYWYIDGECVLEPETAEVN